MAFSVWAGLLALHSGRVPPLWGGSNRWASLSNTMTSPEVANSSASWLFNYFYDATLNASAWHHLEGQNDWVCNQGSSNLTKQGRTCNVVHATDGWLYILFPGDVETATDLHCCKCTDDPAMGFVRADWLRHPEASA